MCSVGKTGPDCSGGSVTTMNWAGAISICSGLSLAGKTWRLPNINELKTIVDRNKSSKPVGLLLASSEQAHVCGGELVLFMCRDFILFVGFLSY